MLPKTMGVNVLGTGDMPQSFFCGRHYKDFVPKSGGMVTWNWPILSVRKVVFTGRQHSLLRRCCLSYGRGVRLSVCLSACHTLRFYQNFTVSSVNLSTQWVIKTRHLIFVCPMLCICIGQNIKSRKRPSVRPSVRRPWTRM